MQCCRVSTVCDCPYPGDRRPVDACTDRRGRSRRRNRVVGIGVGLYSGSGMRTPVNRQRERHTHCSQICSRAAIHMDDDGRHTRLYSRNASATSRQDRPRRRSSYHSCDDDDDDLARARVPYHRCRCRCIYWCCAVLYFDGWCYRGADSKLASSLLAVPSACFTVLPSARRRSLPLLVWQLAKLHHQLIF